LVATHATYCKPWPLSRLHCTSALEPITWGDVAEVWKGEGDAITETVCGLWNTIWHPITTAEGIAEGATLFAKDPGGTLKAIGQQIADDFTGGDLRKAGKLVGLVVITLVTGVAAGKLAPLLRKVPLGPLVRKVVAAASGKPVRLIPEEAETVQRVMGGEALTGTDAARAALGKGPFANPGAPLTDAMKSALGDNLTAAQNTLNNALNGVNNAGKPISSELQQKFINKMTNRINTINNVLNSGVQAPRN